jgi:trans-aconitate 2-methyltransferase
MSVEPWKQYFRNMTFPYYFYDEKEYRAFLCKAGLFAERVELFPKDMKFNNSKDLAGWVRTKWLPFTDRLPEELRAKFVQEIVVRYLKANPAYTEGMVDVATMCIEVEVHKP